MQRTRGKITKKEESQQDLKRYYKILPDCEIYEVREFFLNGIVSLDRSLDKEFNEDAVWELYRMIEDSPYNHSELARRSCVERKDIEAFMQGTFPDNKTMKQMYVGIKHA